MDPKAFDISVITQQFKDGEITKDCAMARFLMTMIDTEVIAFMLENKGKMTKEQIFEHVDEMIDKRAAGGHTDMSSKLCTNIIELMGLMLEDRDGHQGDATSG